MLAGRSWPKEDELRQCKAEAADLEKRIAADLEKAKQQTGEEQESESISTESHPSPSVETDTYTRNPMDFPDTKTPSGQSQESVSVSGEAKSLHSAQQSEGTAHSDQQRSNQQSSDERRSDQRSEVAGHSIEQSKDATHTASSEAKMPAHTAKPNHTSDIINHTSEDDEILEGYRHIDVPGLDDDKIELSFEVTDFDQIHFGFKAGGVTYIESEVDGEVRWAVVSADHYIAVQRHDADIFHVAAQYLDVNEDWQNDDIPVERQREYFESKKVEMNDDWIRIQSFRMTGKDPKEEREQHPAWDTYVPHCDRSKEERSYHNRAMIKAQFGGKINAEHITETERGIYTVSAIIDGEPRYSAVPLMDYFMHVNGQYTERQLAAKYLIVEPMYLTKDSTPEQVERHYATFREHMLTDNLLQELDDMKEIQARMMKR